MSNFNIPGITMEFAKRLQELRKERNLTQEDLAAKLNISSQSISKWENNLSTPDLEMLLNICKILNVSTDYILGNDNTAYIANKDPNKLLLKLEILDNGDVVRINLPLVIIKNLLESNAIKIIDKDILNKIDFNLIFSLIDKGVVGKLIEIDTAENEHISVYAE